MKLYGECKFNAVGQGLFYSMIVKKQMSDVVFSMAYDCGTKTKSSLIKSEIDDFKKKLNDKKLNMLVISHFHDDHISHIPMLLEDIVTDLVVIPYVQPLDRIVFASLVGFRSSRYTELMLFIKNPENYLTNKGVKTIWVMNSNDEPPLKKNNERYIHDDMFAYEDSENRVFGWLRTEKIIGNTSIKELNSKNIIMTNKSWWFIFHQPHYNHIKPSLHKKIQDYLDSNKIAYNDVFHDKKHLKEIRNIYLSFVKTSSSLNNTSIMLYHSPIHCDESYTIYYPYVRLEKCGTLLTGDIKLNPADDLGRIKCHTPNVSVFQVPHHGSDDNWKYDWMKYHFDSYVISSGLTHPKHPGRKVKSDLIGSHVMPANELSRVEYWVICSKSI